MKPLLSHQTKESLTTKHWNWFVRSGDFLSPSVLLELPSNIPANLLLSLQPGHHPPKSVLWFQTTEILSSALSIPIQSDDSVFWMPNVLITSSAINHLLPVPSSPNGAFTLIVIYYWYLGFLLMSWTSKWIDHKHFKSRNCLCFFVSSNAPTTVAFLLCALINIFIWFDFTEIVPGYANCVLHNNYCFFKMSHVIFWAQYERQ